MLCCKAFANEFSDDPVAVLTWQVNGQITHSGQETQTFIRPGERCMRNLNAEADCYC